MIKSFKTISDEEKELATLEEKNVQIFGGTGFLGSWVNRDLAGAWDTRCSCRQSVH
jgi:hypothetical protein